ncbi:MAG: hypothetical protein WC595_01820 [Candidatus Nanoarchaeia archaeon]
MKLYLPFTLFLLFLTACSSSEPLAEIKTLQDCIDQELDLTDQTTADLCYGDVARAQLDLTFCEKIIDQERKDFCYYDLSTANKDVTLCEKIKSDSKKRGCIQTIQPAQALPEKETLEQKECSKLISPEEYTKICKFSGGNLPLKFLPPGVGVCNLNAGRGVGELEIQYDNYGFEKKKKDSFAHFNDPEIKKVVQITPFKDTTNQLGIPSFSYQIIKYDDPIMGQYINGGNALIVEAKKPNHFFMVTSTYCTPEQLQEIAKLVYERY